MSPVLILYRTSVGEKAYPHSALVVHGQVVTDTLAGSAAARDPATDEAAEARRDTEGAAMVRRRRTMGGWLGARV